MAEWLSSQQLVESVGPVKSVYRCSVAVRSVLYSHIMLVYRPFFREIPRRTDGIIIMHNILL